MRKKRTMDATFGKNILQEAHNLEELGKDPNQIAKILCEQDRKGYNYGIGIMLDGHGRAMASSATLLEYISAELGLSAYGDYMNSAQFMTKLQEVVLKWQRIPETYWKHFQLALPSDSGTGAVQTSIEVELLLNPRLTAIGVEALGWPAYKAMAKVARILCQEFPSDGVIAESGVLPVYQSGPLNTIGVVHGRDLIQARAKSAADRNTHVILDRAYPGFEYARLLDTHSYDALMQKSYALQIEPFIEQGVSFSLAIGPTKSFVTFALRPCGFLLVYCPDASRQKEVTTALNTIMRARGCSFEHPITRAFVKALYNDLPRLEAEHEMSLRRLAQAETIWAKLTQGTPMASLFSDKYAGLFRNPKSRADAALHIYNEHLYPVLTKDRCRLNVTGIPFDEQLAKQHVAVFAQQCYEN
jgi:hypothetical protein